MSAAPVSVRIAAPAAVVASAAAPAVAVYVLVIGESVLPVGTRSDYTTLVAALLAIVAAAGLQRSGSARTAWMLASGAIVVLGSVRYLVASNTTADGLTAVGLVTAATTGVLLGAAVSGAWSTPGGPGALVAGGWAGLLTAPAVGMAMPTAAVPWTVTQWLLAIALIATVGSAVTVPTGGRGGRVDPQVLVVAAIAAVVLVAGYRLLGDLLTDHGPDGPWLWPIAVGVLVASVIGAELVARQVPSGDDRFVLAVTGAVAAAYPVLIEVVGGAPWWTHVVAVTAVAVGAWAAPYAPYPAAGLVVAFAVSAAAVLWPAFADAVPLPVRVALVAAGCALALAASLPGSATVAALGMALPVPATAVIGAVWLVPGNPQGSAIALAATAAVCAWQVR
ncbi:hypothetical protein [Rhodococcus yananensis]|uniref:hypothetical protein n=1 Tax=Rhodococcus yananensis TaxID=2879464 RepID=UPI001CF807B4|nr:hypothetical protein [Rhodococcus yananensis]